MKKLIRLFSLCLAILTTSTCAETLSEQLTDAALERTKHRVTYDGKYVTISYPNGDVPANIGVCTDVVIRAYRQLGIDYSNAYTKI